MREIREDVQLIARCGLYCGACKRYLTEKCKGCHENGKASWCKLRLCCMEKNIASCADCKEFSNVMDCGKYNNFMARIFGFIFNSNRSACITKIRQTGYEAFAREMAENRIVSFKR